MRLLYHVMSAPAPIGLLLLVRSDRGLRHVVFMNQKSLKRVQADLAPGNPGVTWEHSVAALRDVVDQFDEYFDGTRKRFELALDPAGTPFQLQTWAALRAIPYGQTRAYGELAKAIGQPGAARAVGLANNQNPLPVIVPCHRVIGADGKLVGYVGGVARKKALLELERRGAKLGPLDENRVIGEARVVIARAPAAPARRRKVAAKRTPAPRGRAAAPARPTSRRAVAAAGARRGR